MREVVNGIATSAGATADVDISMEDAMMANDTALTELSVPVLKKDIIACSIGKSSYGR